MEGIPTRRVGPLIGPDLDLSVDQCRYANGRDETVARSRPSFARSASCQVLRRTRRIPHRRGRSRPTPGVCSMFWATSGNGPKTAGTTATTAPRRSVNALVGRRLFEARTAWWIDGRGSRRPAGGFPTRQFCHAAGLPLRFPRCSGGSLGSRLAQPSASKLSFPCRSDPLARRGGLPHSFPRATSGPAHRRGNAMSKIDRSP